VRGEQALTALSDQQWDSLLPVGELRIEPISFGRGTARINLQSLRDLKALAGTLNSWPQYYLTVTGQVRPGGDEQAALELAKTRADAAVAVLLDEGVAPERIRAFSKAASANSADAQSVSFMVGQLPY
jgi:outer membrane protein OmpA-like peptidoglycan-associated protein